MQWNFAPSEFMGPPTLEERNSLWIKNPDNPLIKNRMGSCGPLSGRNTLDARRGPQHAVLRWLQPARCSLASRARQRPNWPEGKAARPLPSLSLAKTAR
jgi:hypothetical protein